MNKKLHIVLFVFFALGLGGILVSFQSKKNEWTLIRSIKTSPIQKVSIDTYFNFFTADDKGNVFKFDSTGNQLLRFSPLKKADVTLLEASRSVNIFIFYRDIQEYVILDRFLTTSNTNFTFHQDADTDEKQIGFARLATLASDNNLWVFDDTDFSLKKYNTRINKTIIHTPLDLILDPSYYDLKYIREYQNLLFINDKNSGILIFDNLGNYKTKIPFEGVSYFNFLGNNLYFIANGNLVVYDIYTLRQKTIPLPSGKTFTHVLLSDNKVYLFTTNSIELYNYRDL